MSAAPVYCGLICDTCPIHLATGEANPVEQDKMRAEIVRLCQQHYGMEYRREDITDCDGCRTETGRLFAASRSCPIRNCARQRDLENCAYCSDYACERLSAFFAKEPNAKTRLDELRSRIR